MAIWEQDPQNRPEVEKVTKNLKLPVWQAWYKGKFRDFWNECWGKIEDGYNKLGIDKVDKGGYTGTAKTLDDRITSVNNTLNSAKADKTINIIAGNGLTGGGDLSTNRSISVGATDDSVVVGGTGIKVNTYNGLDSTSTTRPLSANAGKLLNDKVDDRVYTKSLTTLPENNIPWNAKTGIYVGTYTGASSLVWHMYTGVVSSVQSVQLKFNHKNGGIAYKSSRDNFGFEESWTKIITEKEFDDKFDKTGGIITGNVTVNGGVTIKSNGGGFEIYGTTPFIDFHRGNSTADFTSRIIDYSDGLYYASSERNYYFKDLVTYSEFATKLDKGGYTGTAKTLDDRITSVNAQAVTNIRLGAKVNRTIWHSTQSATEDVGYITVSVKNQNADDVPDIEVRRPLQFLKNGIWYTVAVV